MGSSKSKEVVPVEYADGTYGCVTRKTKKPKTKVDKSNPCSDSCAPQTMPMTQTVPQPTGPPFTFNKNPQCFHEMTGSNMVLMPPHAPHINTSTYLTAPSAFYNPPLATPMYTVSTQALPAGNLYKDEDKINRLFKEFVAISGNGNAMDFNSFRVLFLSALCRVDFKNANEFALSTFSQFDKNRDGYIDFEEFLNGYQILEEAERSHLARVPTQSAHLFSDVLHNALPEKNKYPASPYIQSGHDRTDGAGPQSYGKEADRRNDEHF